jgi:hypothetical protein
MKRKFLGSISVLALMILPQASATNVPSLTFDELTDRSEVIVAGRITRSWSDWDSERKFIWTHYELNVSSVHKGAARIAVIVSEPGGVVGGRGMKIAGSVEYSPGDQVAVFLQRMPNGYLRTAGWGQGKYLVDKAGHLHADGSLHGIEMLRGIEMVDTDRRDKSSVVAGNSLRALEGIGIGDLRARVLARVTTQRQGSTR